MNLIRASKKIIGFLKGRSGFNINNPLGGNGERVDIQMKDSLDYDQLDLYQKSHYKRYEFALNEVKEGDICGDFACGTGYGSVLLSKKASKVIGADINEKVIIKIKERYKANRKVEFHHANILALAYTNVFDVIVSFETLEHLKENDLKKGIQIFGKALKPGGTFIFSTPFMQEKSEDALKLGFHLTFYINEEKLNGWVEEAGLKMESFNYQNYESHTILPELQNKDFIICKAIKQ